MPVNIHWVRIKDYVMTAVDQENIIERLIPSMQEINRDCGESVSLQVWTHDPWSFTL